MREGSAAVILLAAGSSSRFGGPKLLANLNGRPLVEHAAELVGVLGGDGTLACAVAVVCPDMPEVADIVRTHGMKPVVNFDPADGMASSLRVGIAELRKQNPVPDAALIFLADQPEVRADTIHTIISAWRTGTKPVVRPRYSQDPGTPGHPVLVARPAWHLFGSIDGDHGLGDLLRQRPGLVETVLIPGANPGVNTPADLSGI